MKWKLKTLAASLVMLPLMPAFGQTVQVFKNEQTIEAEQLNPGGAWALVKDDSASGKAYLKTMSTQPTELKYTIELEHGGDYVIWARVFLGDNAFNVSINGQKEWGQYIPHGVAASEAPAGKWIWTKFYESEVKGKLQAGKNELRITPRKANVRIDSIIVSTYPNFRPSDEHPTPDRFNALPRDHKIPLPKYFPTGESPRLAFRAADLETIRQRRTAAQTNTSGEYPALKSAWDRLHAVAALTAFPKKLVDGQSVIDCAQATKMIQAKALLYQVDQNEAMGKDAIATMLRYYQEAECQWGKDVESRAIGRTILSSAMVFDWCYPLLVSDEETKRIFLMRFLELAGRMEIGFAPRGDGPVTGHNSEAQLLRDQLAAGIAFYNYEPEIYNITAGRICEKYIEPRNYAYAAAGHYQGTSYGPVRYQADLYASWLLRRLGVSEDLFAPSLGSVPYQWLTLRRPDGQLMRDGDSYWGAQMTFGAYWAEPNTYMLAANYFRDPQLKSEFRRMLPNWVTQDDIWMVLINDPELAPAGSDAAALPLTHFSPDPIGQMVVRTGWRSSTQADLNSPIVVATMNVGSTRFGNHQHLDAGQFQLYYKGALAIDSGVYAGKDVVTGKDISYFSEHDKNYHKRTVAHNAMLVWDESEKFAIGANDGGQLFFGEPTGISDLKKRELASATRHRIGPVLSGANPAPAFSYLKGDLAKTYSAKVSQYTRSFVFLNLDNAVNPAALLVHDKISSSNANFQKNWLLHSVQEPKIEGDTVTILRTDRGYNGKLVNRTILPKTFDIHPVGGPGREYAVFNPQTRTYQNYPINFYQANNSEEAGAWRIEVSPPATEKTHTFLNVMQVMDASGNVAALPTQAIGTGDSDSDKESALEGVKIADRVVLFAKVPGNDLPFADLGGATSFTLPAFSGQVKVLITDLAPGSWSVISADGRFRFDGEAGAQDGALYFDTSLPGKYTLRPNSK